MCDVEDCATMFVPGPGAYSPNIMSTTFNSGSPQFTMKGRMTDGPQRSGSPGPGTYNLPSSIGGKGSTLAGRTQVQKISDVPGPGTYSPQRNNKNHGASLAGRTQIDFNKNDTPAPCSYNVSEYTQLGRHAPKISMAGRTQTHQPESGPGFAYDPKLQKSNIGTTMAGRTTLGNTRNEVPGPGAYSITNRSSSPSHSLASRTVDMSSKPTHDVGPGAYESPERAFKYTQKLNSGSSLAGRTTDAFSRPNANPGPGTYVTPSQFNATGAGSSLAGRVQTDKISDVPGPGAYSPQRTDRNQGSSLAGRTQIDFNKNDTPAPCSYNVTEYTQLGRHAPKISMAGRTQTHQPEPGPGFAYDPKIQKSNIGTTLAGRTTLGNTRNEVPGPGTYSVQNRSSSPSHSLASRTIDMSSKPTHDVGPGAYNSPERAFKYTQKLNSGSSLASRTTDAFSRPNANPGPGTYVTPSQFNATGAGSSLAGRVQTDKVSDVPGPGAYSPQRNERVSTAPSLAGRTFKPGTQDWEIRKQQGSPSPCAYNLDRKATGGISMAGRPKIEQNNDNPGPGSYSLKGDFDRSGVGSTMAGRTSVAGGDRNPGVGPGSYMLKSTLKSGGITMSGRPKKRGGIIFD